jgi:hypothetical protein
VATVASDGESDTAQRGLDFLSLPYWRQGLLPALIKREERAVQAPRIRKKLARQAATAP